MSPYGVTRPPWINLTAVETKHLNAERTPNSNKLERPIYHFSMDMVYMKGDNVWSSKFHISGGIYGHKTIPMYTWASYLWKDRIRATKNLQSFAPQNNTRLPAHC